MFWFIFPPVRDYWMKLHHCILFHLETGGGPSLCCWRELFPLLVYEHVCLST